MPLRVPFNILLWWDTKIVIGAHNSYYFEGPMKDSLILDRRIQYEQFVNRIYQLMGLSNDQYQLKLTLLYPTLCGSQYVCVLMNIKSDEDMKKMYSLQQLYNALFTVQIHVEKIEIVESTACTQQNAQVSQVMQHSDMLDLNVAHIGRSSRLGDCSNVATVTREPLSMDMSSKANNENLGTLLTLQQNHRSSLASSEYRDYVLKCRRGDKKFWQAIPFHPRVEEYIFRAGFEGVYRACNNLRQLKYDRALITAFVERWRQETHTFWMPFGEVGITLQDVEVIWGLRVDGRHVRGYEVGRSTVQWQEVCQELIGFSPPEDAFEGNRLNTNTFTNALAAEILENATEIQIMQRARMRLLQLFGGLLFADKSGNMVHLSLLELLRDLDGAASYSWGSAVLAYLYRNLCNAAQKSSKEISGPALLLQLWAWERFPTLSPEIRQPVQSLPEGAPLAAKWSTSLSRTKNTANNLRGYRDSIDGLLINYFIWMPYTSQVIESLPAYCKAGREIWKSRVPLIFFHIVEMHLPDRVLRQFGQFQPIPQHPDTLQTLHRERRGRPFHNWEMENSMYIQMWDERLQYIAASYDIDDVSRTSPEYLDWYRQHYIGPISSIDHSNSQPAGYEGSASADQYLTSFVHEYYYAADDLLQHPNFSIQESREFIERFRARCRDAFSRLGRSSLLEYRPTVRDASVSILGRRRSSERPSTDRRTSDVHSNRAGPSALHIPEDAPTAT